MGLIAVGLCVTLPLNVSRDLGSVCVWGATRLSDNRHRPLWSPARTGHKVLETLGHKMLRAVEEITSREREIEPLCLVGDGRRVAIQEDQAGVLVFHGYILSTTQRGL